MPPPPAKALPSDLPRILAGNLMAWRIRSLYVSLTGRLIINNVFILMMVAALLRDG